MSYNTKNYTEQGGAKTVIGGELEVKTGARVIGLLSKRLNNQLESEATTLAQLTNDFNALISNLKLAGIMIGDDFTISAKAIPTKPNQDLTFNHGKVRSIVKENDKITINAPVEELKSFESEITGEGQHKWLGLCITTGLTSIIGIKLNETYSFTNADVTKATTCGGEAGDFILWIKAEQVQKEPVEYTISNDGYEPETIKVEVINQA